MCFAWPFARIGERVLWIPGLADATGCAHAVVTVHHLNAPCLLRVFMPRRNPRAADTPDAFTTNARLRRTLCALHVCAYAVSRDARNL